MFVDDGTETLAHFDLEKESMRNGMYSVAVGLSLSLATTLVVGDERKSIVETAVGAGQFKTLAAALTAGGLVEALEGKGPFTVFAPTDAAFGKLPKGTLETLLKPENKATLVAILKHHVVSGSVPAKKVVALTAAATLNGQRVDVSTKKGTVMIDSAKVIQADIHCTNGVIHVIDKVLIPEAGDIVDVAVGSKAPTFQTLVAAVKAAGLVKALKAKGPLTVFAPTDAAFGRLPEGTIAMLLKPENRERLSSILTYHVVAGRVYSPKALQAGAASTLQGSKLSIRAKGGVAYVNDAQIVATDLDAANGVIHVIDTVLLSEGDGCLPRVTRSCSHCPPCSARPAWCRACASSVLESSMCGVPWMRACRSEYAFRPAPAANSEHAAGILAGI